jgi:hypothetical protein
MRSFDIFHATSAALQHLVAPAMSGGHLEPLDLWNGYRRLALGGTAPGGTCSLGSVGDPVRQREREKLLSSLEYVEESMKGRGWLCRSLVGTQGWSARKPRSGASAARLRGGRSISPTFVVLVEDLLQLASATASRSYPVPSSCRSSGSSPRMDMDHGAAARYSRGGCFGCSGTTPGRRSWHDDRRRQRAIRLHGAAN